MVRLAGEFTVALMARVLGVSRSAYYAWRARRAPCRRRQAREQLDAQVSAAFDAAKGRNGAPRLTRDLAAAGHRYDRKTVAKSLQRQCLRAKAARRFKATTDSRHNLPVAPKPLAQDFSAATPNAKWGADISVPQQAA